MSYLRYLCLFACRGVQHILCCVFVLLFFVLLVSLDCPFLIAPSEFSNVYLLLFYICLYQITYTFFSIYSIFVHYLIHDTN
jgi:hypothetical protein